MVLALLEVLEFLLVICLYPASLVKMLSAPAGNDILFDESLCEQGRNFNNKIWNALASGALWK